MLKLRLAPVWLHTTVSAPPAVAEVRMLAVAEPLVTVPKNRAPVSDRA